MSSDHSRPGQRVRGPRDGVPGYTLLELVLVIGIIFLFSAVVAPRFSDFVPALRVDRAGEEVLATARKAHADAALHGVRYRLNIDTEGREYWLTVQGNPFEDGEEWTELPGVWGERTKLPDGVHFDTDKTEYEFLPDGTATEGTLTLSDDRENRVTIKIVGSTGRVYFEGEDEDDTWNY